MIWSLRLEYLFQQNNNTRGKKNCEYSSFSNADFEIDTSQYLKVFYWMKVEVVCTL